MSSTEAFDKQLAGLVNSERSAVYGHPLDNFTTSAALLKQIEHCKDPELKFAMQMILAKIARLCQTPDHVDSWIDVAGYARCAVMILDKRSPPEGV